MGHHYWGQPAAPSLIKGSRWLAMSRWLLRQSFFAGWPALEWTRVAFPDDPVNRKGRLIPVFLRDFSSHLNQTVDLPAPFRSLNWIDFPHLASLSSRSENSFDAFGISRPNAGGVNDHWRWRGLCQLQPRNLRHRLPLTGSRMLFSVICYQWSRIRGQSGVLLPRPGRGKMCLRANRTPDAVHSQGEKALYVCGPYTGQRTPSGRIEHFEPAESRGCHLDRQRPDHWRWFIDLMHKSLQRRSHWRIAHSAGRSWKILFFARIRMARHASGKIGANPEREVAAFKRGQDDASGF